jgi:hypothetical protein
MIKVDFRKADMNEAIKTMMMQVYDFEQQEQRLYLENGYKTRMEPYVVSLFWS